MRALFLLLFLPALFASCLQSPTWGAPAVVQPGGTFTLKASSRVLEVYALANGTERSLDVLGSGTQVRVKANLPYGLYDLEVVTEGGKCYQHNALWVVPDLKSLTVMHLTDEHFGVYTDRWAYQYVLAAITIANSDPNVQAIFVTGDVADTAMPYQYELARLVHGLSLKPVFVVPGNHDHVNPLDAYSEYVGPHRWVRRIGKVLVVGLDTGAEGYLTYSDASWAYKVLKENADVKVVLFHHPLIWGLYGKTFYAKSWKDFYKDVLEHLYKSWKKDREGLKEFLKALYYNKVTAALSGHVHLDECARFEPKDFWMVVTTTTGGPVRKGDYRGFRIITLGHEVETRCKGKHQSFSLEGTYAQLGRGKYAWVTIFKLTDKKLLKLMPKLVLAVPVPFKHFKVYAPGFQKVWERCTPAFCAVYAEARLRPNKVYRLGAYVRPDEEPPQVLNLTYPKSVKVGEPFEVSFVAKDDSWGVANVTVVVKGPGYSLKARLAPYNGVYRLRVPPPKEPRTLHLKLILEDYYGHRTVKEFGVRVVPSKTERPAQLPWLPELLLAVAAVLLFFLI